MLALLKENAELRQQLTKRQYREQVLLETKQQLQRLLAFSPAVIYNSRPDGNYGITYISESINQLGYEPQEFLKDTGLWQRAVHPEDLPYVLNTLAQLIHQESQVLEYRFLHQNGGYRWLQDQRRLICDVQGRPIEIVGAWQDITERKDIELALFQEKELAQNVLQSLGDGVITTDIAGRIQYVNPVAEQLTGWQANQAIGSPLAEVFQTLNEVTRQTAENLVEKVCSSGKVVGLSHPTLLIARDEAEHTIDHSAAPIRDRQNRIIGTVIVFRDMTQYHSLARKLSWQASHDSLTGLVNRREFEQQLAEAIISVREQEQQHVLCYLDLDQFKWVNDTCGHVAGDELLRQLAALLQQQVRAADTLGRLGGDEFGILLHQCNLDSACRIADAILKKIQSFRFAWQNNTFTIGVSIGLVAIDLDSGDLNSVLSAADAACYAAKDKGRNQVHIYQTDDSELVRQRGERQWVARLSNALQENRFQLYRQAIVPLGQSCADRAQHWELLVRMVSEQGEVVPPMAFIPAAERYGLMAAVDRWVISRFFSSYAALNPSSQPDTQPLQDQYAINLSGASLNDDQFLDFLREQFERHAVPPQAICFEVTETAAIANLARAVPLIRELKQIGCCFALDHFGSGMSSLAYLKNLPIDYLKIDGYFVKNIVNDVVDRAMVECINRIGHVMGLYTIAGFVENDEILGKLRELGVDYAQGYGIDEPVPLNLAP
ncbi:EAL domain-containing protein [Phormidium tenue FACHB-886]|nr:EAL domain-containing protein [Phormidium tenue FACHB-886]